jgi:parallel beta-helix repeat protein
MRNLARTHSFFTKQVRIALALFAIGIAIATSPGRAAAQVPSCAATISSCGCLIRNSGLFTVGATSLTTSGKTSCLFIRAKNVALNLNSAPIMGPNNGSSTGSGIEIDKGSSNVFIEGNGAVISGFEFGINNLANNVTLEDLTVQNNDDAGVHFARASNSAISMVTAQNNGGYGIWLEGSTLNTVGGNTQVLTNFLDGLLIGCKPVVGTGVCGGIGAGSNQNNIFDVTATGNGTGDATGGGVTLQFNSRFNSIGRSSGSMNAKADFYDRHAAGACGGNNFFSITGSQFGACF